MTHAFDYPAPFSIMTHSTNAHTHKRTHTNTQTNTIGIECISPPYSLVVRHER